MNTYSNMNTNLLKLFLALTIFIFHTHATNSTQFDRELIGVAFSPYVRTIPLNQHESIDRKWYTLDDIKTMLRVVSGKFSKLATFGGALTNAAPPYKPNITYYQNSFSQLYTPEAAAVLNLEKNSKSLTVLVGVWITNDPIIMQTELQLAKESILKANTIYPGTAWGFVISENYIDTNPVQAEIALTALQFLKNKDSEANLKLGTRQNCSGMNGNQNNPLYSTRKAIVEKSDFIICVTHSTFYTPNYLQSALVFEQIKKDLLHHRDELKLINPSIQVMGQTGFSTVGDTQDEFANLKEYWKLVDEFATENNFPMWMFEAFDNPWKNWDAWAAHYGWWKLRSNADVGNVNGYIEKASIPRRTPRKNDDIGRHLNTGASIWTYIAVAISLSVAISVICLFVYLYIRFKKLRAFLSKEDVKEFLDGKRSVNSKQTIDGINCPAETAALTKPYDRSFEISKEDLQILWDWPLGVGQFGCVFKAILKTSNGKRIEVALKMAKSGCKKDAMKSLLSEIKIMTYLGGHVNLVSLQGAYTAEIQRGVVYVASEFCELGCLKNYLRNFQRMTSETSNIYEHSEESSRDSQEALSGMDTTNQNELQEMARWSYEIACGMEYLESKHVVHADLATRNVLLTANKTAKITDFGLSRRLYDYENYVKKQQEPLPWRWMSIEALRKLEFSSQSDVWSYGITIWEIFSVGDVPYPGLSWTLDFLTKLENGLRMECPKYASPEIYDIMAKCWEAKPQDRPTFGQLKLAICKIMEND